MKDILDILLDKENQEPIALMDENGNTVNFQQVAIIPLDSTLYCVLKPIDEIEGIADDEAVVFCVDIDKIGRSFLRVEQDELKAIEVFERYYDLLAEARARKLK